MNKLRYLAKEYFNDTGYFYINRAEEQTIEQCNYHSHDFLELCYVASGSGYHIINDNRYEVYKGDLFIINFNTFHTFIKRNENENLITYNIVIKKGFIEKELMDFSDFSNKTLSYLFNNINGKGKELMHWKTFVRLDENEQNDFEKLLNKMHNEFSLKQEGYINILKAYTIELIVRILRFANQINDADTVTSKKIQTIKNIISYLNENYSKSLHLDTIEEISFFSKNYICKLFKEITGMTIFEHLQIIRINNACNLLLNSDKKITNIALEVGFSDYKAFNKVFKKVKGVLPKKYKNLYSLNEKSLIKLNDD